MHTDRYAAPQMYRQRELSRPRHTAKIAGSRKAFVLLLFSQELDIRGAGQKARGGAALDEGADG